MLTSKNVILDVSEVPSTWVFEYYCSLPERLTGQSVKIKSFWSKDNNPSLFIFFNKKQEKYCFKDFSSNRYGDCYDFVSNLLKIPLSDVVPLVLQEYTDFIKNNGVYTPSEIVPKNSYRVTDFNIRSWTQKDANFWLKFNISSNILNKYNVKPLEYYKMSDGDNEIHVSNILIYGYFSNTGVLYKIYQPFVKTTKFIKVSDYIQGIEQLENHKLLVIGSSLKDIMSIKSLNINVDVIAPDSENTLIKEEVIEELKERYTIVTLFDNDLPGIESMKKYKALYNIPGILLSLSKDVSDSIRDYGVTEILKRLVILFNKYLS
jgi:hypothetical protein